MSPRIQNCIDCGAPLNGRADKRFCDDYCRIHYNNKMKSGSNNLIRNINNALKKTEIFLQAFLKRMKRRLKFQEKNYWATVLSLNMEPILIQQKKAVNTFTAMIMGTSNLNMICFWWSD